MTPVSFILTEVMKWGLTLRSRVLHFYNVFVAVCTSSDEAGLKELAH